MTLTRGFKALNRNSYDMWSAPPMLAKSLRISKKEAYRIWELWRESFRKPITKDGVTFFEGKVSE
jgi:hypothetical protein